MTIFERVDRLERAIDGAPPFEDPMIEEIRKYYPIGLTWSSNAREGNTLTEREKEVVRLLHISAATKQRAFQMTRPPRSIVRSGHITDLS